MLTQICQYLRNWFERDKLFDTFTVADGALSAEAVSLSDFLQDGQYYRIVGSVLNDGVHKWGAEGDTLNDERPFSGAVWSMAIPPDIIALDGEVESWLAKYGEAVNSPFSSESIPGVYSYSKSASAGSGEGGGSIGWQTAFRARLAPWRKI